jgi:hypothetical protein
MRDIRHDRTVSDSNSPKVYRCEGLLATVQIKPLIFTLFCYTSSEQGRRRPSPRFFAAGAGGVATVETFTCAAA